MENQEIDYELENLKEFIKNGGRCWLCGDTGIAEPTLQYPEGSPCDCPAEYSAEYVLQHWNERKLNSWDSMFKTENDESSQSDLDF